VRKELTNQIDLMQSLEQRRGVGVQWTPVLSSYIQKCYELDSAPFAEDLQRLDQLRQQCLSAQASVGGIEQLSRYFGLVRELAARLDLKEESFKISFGWYNSMGKDTKRPVSSQDIRYELASILFNIAAMHSRLAAQETFGSVDSLKKACNQFLVAAGVLQRLLDDYAGQLDLPSGTDLALGALNSYQQLMLAEAQECFLRKGIMEKVIKDGTLAKLAFSASLLFEASLREAMDSKASTLFDEAWCAQLRAKARLYEAMAHYRKSIEFLLASQYGHEIVKLQQASEAINKARELSGKKSLLAADLVMQINTMAMTIEKDLGRASKDNTIIYHAVIPPRGPWGEPGNAVIAKASSWPADENAFTMQTGTPLCASLLPLNEHRQIYELVEIRSQVENQQQQRIRSLMEPLDQMLHQLSEASVEQQGIPPDLQSKSTELQASGGLLGLESSQEIVRSMREDCEGLLADIEQSLNEEETKDGEMRARYGAQWVLPPSSHASSNLKLKLSGFRNLLDQSLQGDKTVQEGLETHRASISNLLSIEEKYAERSHEQMAIANRKAFLAQGSFLRQQATRLENQVRDILFGVSLEDGDAFEERLLKSLEETFQGELNSLDKEVTQVLPQLEQFLSSLRPLISAEDQKEMEEAYQAFLVISKQLEEATRFYSGLQSQMSEAFGECRQFVARRLAEHQDLERRLLSFYQQPPVAPPMMMHQQYHQNHYQQQQQQQQHHQQYAAAQPGQWNPGMPIQCILYPKILIL